MATQHVAPQPETSVGSEPHVNVLSLVSAQASRITNVSLYSGRAEITRSFKIALVKGQNQISIRGLPDVLQKDSVRVEGVGNASIHDVVISKTPRKVQEIFVPDVSLERKRQQVVNRISSIKQTRASLDEYLATIKANEVDISKLEDIFANHNLLAARFDNQIMDLESELVDIALAANPRYTDPLADDLVRLPWQVAINVYAKHDEKVKIILKYVVSNADWSASYDIRADTQSTGNNIIILYKASITQNTGESWDGIPLTLETVTPTFGMVAPSLNPWHITEVKPRHFMMPAGVPMYGMPPVIISPRSRSSSRSRAYSPPRRRRSRSSSPRSRDVPAMRYQSIPVTNKGGVAATFLIPGYINVPSDAQQHNVTIATMDFKVPLLWHTIPKVDARVYMEAKIKNESEYTFIAGPANVYVDGSFIATTRIPLVSPEETFQAALGLDASLRVTYHRREKNANTTGFYKKSAMKSFTQRITILNTKATAIQNLKVVDAIPISQDERIEIKLLKPALPHGAVVESTRKTSFIPGSSEKGGNNSKEFISARVKVAQGVVALWDGADDPHIDQETVGKNGRVRWDVSLRSQESITLVLKCDVSYPENLNVEGI